MRRILAAVVVAVTLLATACSSDEGKAEPAGGTTKVSARRESSAR